MQKLLWVVMLLGWSFASAAELKVGDAIPAFSAKDQHGESFELKPGLRTMLVAFDMSDGKAANKQLSEKGATYLTERNAVFVSNIHGMPGIGRAFALPKMRKYPHRIVLADSETLLAPFPKQKERVTVLTLDSAGKIEAIKFWDPDKQPIDQALGAAR